MKQAHLSQLETTRISVINKAELELDGNEPYIAHFKRCVFIMYVNERPYNPVL